MLISTTKALKTHTIFTCSQMQRCVHLSCSLAGQISHFLGFVCSLNKSADTHNVTILYSNMEGRESAIVLMKKFQASFSIRKKNKKICSYLE